MRPVSLGTSSHQPNIKTGSLAMRHLVSNIIHFCWRQASLAGRVRRYALILRVAASYIYAELANLLFGTILSHSNDASLQCLSHKDCPACTDRPIGCSLLILITFAPVNNKKTRLIVLRRKARLPGPWARSNFELRNFALAYISSFSNGCLHLTTRSDVALLPGTTGGVHMFAILCMESGKAGTL